MAIQKIFNSVKLSAIDAAKYAFRKEGFISSLCAFFKGRTITVVEASDYSEKYHATKLSNLLRHNITLSDIEKEEETYNALQNDIEILQKENVELNEILSNPMTQKRKSNEKKKIEHQQFLTDINAQCDNLISEIKGLQNNCEEYNKRLSAIKALSPIKAP